MSTLLGLAAALVAIGCGDDDAATPEQEVKAPVMTEAATTEAAEPAAKPKRTGRVIKVVDSDYGRVLADRKGEALYLFDKEQTKTSRCYGACAAAWPPALTKGEPRAGSGAVQRLLVTTRRRDGKLQVTYRGHPLYYYVRDTPGNILCQNVDEFGGLWLVVKPDGSPVA
jgi:predicted lipoprotein with Yx(FWY)xxD motif